MYSKSCCHVSERRQHLTEQCVMATHCKSFICGSGGSPSLSVLSRHYPDFKCAVVSEAYVRSQLRGLKPGKAVGLDNIPARVLVDSADIVAKPLTTIINISLQSGVVPLEKKKKKKRHFYGNFLIFKCMFSRCFSTKHAQTC